jgi:GNAT superfamily N-acetyltransferase
MSTVTVAVVTAQSEKQVLPDSTSPELRLSHPTDEENRRIWQLTSNEWKDALTIPQYMEESAYLMTIPLADNKGMTQWILVDRSLAPNQRQILASCETFRKLSLISYPMKPSQLVVVHGIASVYCNPDYRGRGYASRLLKELSKSLPTWQCEGKPCVASVLFSDIQPKFYEKLGWHHFSSDHLEFEPAVVQRSALPVYAKDVAKLCALDVARLEQAMSRSSKEDITRLLILPDNDHMRWHHSKEEFVAQKLFGKTPLLKGAISGVRGQAVWAIWTHRFYDHPDKNPTDNTLYILRFVVEDLQLRLDTEDNIKHLSDQQIMGVREVLQAAQAEAAEWNLHKIKLWNPSHCLQRAIQLSGISFQHKHRTQDSIPCLQWYGEGSGKPESLNWLLNEKYGWC